MLELVKKLEDIRKVPQFIFCDHIFPPRAAAVRIEVDKLVNESGNLKEVDIILNSGGGMPDEAYRIMRCFRKNFEIVNVIIPFWAKSAAAIMALGGSRIVFDEFGEMGPIDAQIGIEREDSPEYDRESALNDEQTLKNIEARFRLFFSHLYFYLYDNQKIKLNKKDLAQLLLESSNKFYEPLLKQIDPYGMGRKQRALAIGEKYAFRMLTQFDKLNPQFNDEDVSAFVEYLINGCPDHGFIIDYDLGTQFLSGFFEMSDTFGPEYKSALKDLSISLMEVDEFKFLGFLPKDKVKEKRLQPEKDITSTRQLPNSKKANP
jgi:hypothetical protein